MINVWNSAENSAAQALELKEGSYAADFGFLVAQSVNPEHVLDAATAIKNSGQSVVVASQAGLICKAQELELAFEGWAPLKVF